MYWASPDINPIKSQHQRHTLEPKSGPLPKEKHMVGTKKWVPSDVLYNLHNVDNDDLIRLKRDTSSCTLAFAGGSCCP